MQRTQTNPRSETVPVLRVVVAKEGGMTSQHELVTNVVQFGRSPECEVRLDGKNISRVHCILDVRADGNLWVRDNDSLNGIFVNGEKVKEAIVTARDAVKVGPYRFKAIITGTSTRPISSEARAVVPASKPDMDRTLPAFDTKAKSLAKDGPLPIEEAPLRARPSTSTGVVLEDFVPPIVSGTLSTEDQTPADGTPVASPAAELRAREIAPATAPVAKPSYRSQLEAKKTEAPRAEVRAEAPARVETPRSAPAPRGRMSLTPAAKKSSGPVRMGDLCQSCSTGRMLAWEGGLRCRTCDNRAEMSDSRTAAKAPVSARSSEARPAAKTTADAIGGVKVGEVCGSCYKGNMLKWEGGLRCRSCGNRAEIAASTSSRPTSSARPAARPSIVTPRPSIQAKAPVVEAREPVRESREEREEASSTGTVKVGELCGSCYKGNMLKWEGGLRCRSCGNRAELGAASSSSAKLEARQPAARAAVSARRSESTSTSSREEREPNRTAAVLLGVGLFFGLYITIGVCSIATAILA